jgi:chromosomal replication initiator protein
MSSFWSSCLSQFEQELPPQQFNTWIRPLRLEGEDDFDARLRLLAPNGFILKWVKERYLARIEALGSEYFPLPVNITLSARRTGRQQVPNQAAAATVSSAPEVSGAADRRRDSERDQESATADKDRSATRRRG